MTKRERIWISFLSTGSLCKCLHHPALGWGRLKPEAHLSWEWQRDGSVRHQLLSSRVCIRRKLGSRAEPGPRPSTPRRCIYPRNSLTITADTCCEFLLLKNPFLYLSKWLLLLKSQKFFRIKLFAVSEMEHIDINFKSLKKYSVSSVVEHECWFFLRICFMQNTFRWPRSNLVLKILSGIKCWYSHWKCIY